MLYFILADFGANGRAWVERDVASMGWNATIADIREGQITNVVTVLECSLEGPICSDRTEDALKAAGKFWPEDPAQTVQDAIDWHRDHARELREDA
jgi:hypothetical protein